MEKYRIAGLTVEMEAFGRTKLQAEPYRIKTDAPADITITCDAAKVLELNPYMGDLDMAYYVGSGIHFTWGLLRHQGTYIHSSAILLDGKAYLFSADSGTGKSTHTEKWCRLFGATYLNDDKPAVRLENGVWIAYGTPWSGKHDLSSPEWAPIGGIAFLKRGDTNAIVPMAPKDAVSKLIPQSMWKLSREMMINQLDLTDHLLRNVPIWELTCQNNDEAALLSHKVMTGR